MYKKSLVVLLFLGAIFISKNSFSQNELYPALFSAFPDMPKSMTSSDLKEKGKHGVALKNKQSVILEDILLTDNVIVPIGKMVKGKAVILIYAIVERKEIGSEPDYIHIKTKTLHKKTGEIISSQSHLLDIGTRVTKYDGSFKLVGDDLIEFTQHSESDGETDTEIAQYKFGKYLEFQKHVH